MSNTILELAHRLTQAGEPFVLATVVWCERPTSAKPGAQAIIQADGTMTGWIGGSCAQPVVLREALRILREGDNAYLLRLGAPEVGIERCWCARFSDELHQRRYIGYLYGATSASTATSADRRFTCDCSAQPTCRSARLCGYANRYCRFK